MGGNQWSMTGGIAVGALGPFRDVVAWRGRFDGGEFLQNE